MSETSQAIVSASSPIRQRLTLLFADLSESTRLGRAMEPEEYADVLMSIRAIWQAVAERHGGRVIRAQGDGALIVFGYPTVMEDDGLRAVEAALAINEEVSRLQAPSVPAGFLPLAMHSGVHAGIALVQPGDMERGRIDLTGDVINTAAHLSDAAGRGQVLASLDALGPHANFFELGVVTPGQIDATTTMDVRQVLGRSGVRRRFESTAKRGLTPFIARDRVVAEIEDFVSDVKAARVFPHRCLVVVGPAGMGKTRLLEEVVRKSAAPEMQILRGSCESYLGAEVLQPFVQMVRSYFGFGPRQSSEEQAAIVASRMNPLRELMGLAANAILQLLNVSDLPVQKRITTGGVVGDLVAFFTAVSAQTPLLIIIDDWQWADDASLQLLGALLDATSGPTVLLASRPRDEGGKWIAGAAQTVLEPFALFETQQAVQRWLPTADPFLSEKIHQYSGGIPLYIEELCHSASSNTLSRAIEGRGAAQTWLSGLVATRLARLPEGLTAIVQIAAVIGNEVPLSLAETVVGRALGEEELTTLLDADFLYPTDSGRALRFKHGITRDAIYQHIELRSRMALHERVLAAMQSRSPGTDRDEGIEGLAHHSQGAGHWEQAADFAERAGDKAMVAFALDRARLHYEQGMASLERMSLDTPQTTLRWCQLVNKLGMTCVFDPLALGNDASVFERAVERAKQLGDVNALARATYWLAYILYAIGRSRQALRQSRAALAFAQETGDARLVIQVEAMLGQVLAACSDYDKAIELIDVAVDAKRQRSRPRGGLAIGSAYALACKGGILADRGDFASAHLCFDEAIDLLDGTTHPVGNSVRNWIAVAHNWQGNWMEAKRIALDSLRIAENTRALLLLSAARSSMGYAAWASDGSSAGLRQLSEAMQWMDERQGRFFTSIYFGWLVAAAAADGREGDVRAFAAKVLQRARDGERMGEPVACRSLAWTAIAANDLQGAERWMLRAALAAGRRRSPRELALNQWMRGQLALRQGRMDEAGPCLTQAALRLDAMGMAWHAEQVRQQLQARAVGRPVFT